MALQTQQFPRPESPFNNLCFSAVSVSARTLLLNPHLGCYCLHFAPSRRRTCAKNLLTSGVYTLYCVWSVPVKQGNTLVCCRKLDEQSTSVGHRENLPRAVVVMAARRQLDSFARALATLSRTREDTEMRMEYLDSCTASWDVSCLEALFAMRAVHTFLAHPQCRVLLKIKPLTKSERLCKTLFIQLTLVTLCTIPGRTGSWRNRAELLDILLEEGACILGWMPHHARSMEAVCCSLLRDYGKEKGKWTHSVGNVPPALLTTWNSLCMTEQSVCTQYESDVDCIIPSMVVPMGPHCSDVTPCYPPCMIAAALCLTGAYRDSSETLEFLPSVISASNLPWLKSADDIPATLRERNGPTCVDHTPMDEKDDKNQVTLRKLTCAGSALQPLLSLCRNAIHCGLLQRHQDPFTAAQSLPLSNQMKEYLFGG